MIGKRTGIDFTDYIVEVTKQEGLLIHKLKKIGYSVMYSVTFTNVSGICAITGDYGNWIVCREFHPSKGGSISDGYFYEKLRNSSSQVLSKFNPEETEKELKELLTFNYEDDGQAPLTEEERDWLEDLVNCVDDEVAYTYKAYREGPVGRFDYEDIPFCKEANYWLKVIADAFEEICSRME